MHFYICNMVIVLWEKVWKVKTLKGDIWVLTVGSLVLGSANCQLVKDLEPPGRWVSGMYVRNLVDCAEVGRPDHYGWSYSLIGRLNSVNREMEVKSCTHSLFSDSWLCVQCGHLFQVITPWTSLSKDCNLELWSKIELFPLNSLVWYSPTATGKETKPHMYGHILNRRCYCSISGIIYNVQDKHEDSLQ